MDVSPQLLKEVEFREKFRGYDPDEVDEFLERVSEGVAGLLETLRVTNQRLQRAEAGTQIEGGGPVTATEAEIEGTLRRTLVLAQRTADAAIADAREQAQRTVGEATDRASRMTKDAENEGAVIRAEAEAEARRFVEATRQPLVDEIAELEKARNLLRQDIEILERHVGSHRDRLRATISDLSRLIDDPSSLRIAAVPELSGASLPEPEPIVAETAAKMRTVAEAAGVVETASSSTPVVTPDEPPSVSVSYVEEPTPERRDDPAQGDETMAHPPVVLPAPGASVPATEPDLAGALAADEEELIDISASSVDEQIDLVAPEPVAASALRSSSVGESTGPAGGDAFLEELRRAVNDASGDEPDVMSSFFDDEDNDQSSRFGRRR